MVVNCGKELGSVSERNLKPILYKSRTIKRDEVPYSHQASAAPAAPHPRKRRLSCRFDAPSQAGCKPQAFLPVRAV